VAGVAFAGAAPELVVGVNGGGEEPGRDAFQNPAIAHRSSRRIHSILRAIEDTDDIVEDLEGAFAKAVNG